MNWLKEGECCFKNIKEKLNFTLVFKDANIIFWAAITGALLCSYLSPIHHLTLPQEFSRGLWQQPTCLFSCLPHSVWCTHTHTHTGSIFSCSSVQVSAHFSPSLWVRDASHSADTKIYHFHFSSHSEGCGQHEYVCVCEEERWEREDAQEGKKER